MAGRHWRPWASCQVCALAPARCTAASWAHVHAPPERGSHASCVGVGAETSGLCAGGIWRARAEMGKLARSYDSSRISSSLLGVLLTAGCADIALALARNQSSFQLAGLHQAAMKAAAGQWQDAVEAALGTHKRAIYYPRCSLVTVSRLSVHTRWERRHPSSYPYCRPPPRGSLLWRRLVVLGRTALTFGHIAAARECWHTAGHWSQLLPLCALLGDFDAIRRYIAAVALNRSAHRGGCPAGKQAPLQNDLTCCMCRRLWRQWPWATNCSP